jgi:hypothetical protein
MHEPQLRALVRGIVARHLHRPSESCGVDPIATTPSSHPSHRRFVRLRPREERHELACVIEPAVRCSHCGYCESLGH